MYRIWYIYIYNIGQAFLEPRDRTVLADNDQLYAYIYHNI